MQRAFLVLVGTILIHTCAFATDGNELLTECQSEPGFGSGYCLGLIVGYSYGYQYGAGGGAARALYGDDIMGAFKKDPEGFAAATAIGRNYCIPDGARHGQLQDVVVKYLKDHPEQRHLPANMLINAAMEMAFPCPR